MSQNQGNGVLFEHEGKRRRLDIERDYSSMMNKVKQTFRINYDVELVVHYRKGNVESEETIHNDELEDMAKMSTATTVVAYRKHEDVLGIVIGKENYSLDEVPRSGSNLITVAIHEVVFSQFDVNKFVSGLGGFVKQVRRAHLHLLAVDQRDLSIKMFSLGRHYLQPVTESCGITLDMIVRNCANILTTLVNVFEYLRDGEESSASINLDSLVEMAAAMVTETNDRVKQLEEVQKECNTLLDTISREWANTGKEEDMTKRNLEMKEMMLKRQRERIQKASWWGRFWWTLIAPLGVGGYAKEEMLKSEKEVAEERNSELQEVTEYLTIALGAIKKTTAIMQSMHKFWEGTKKAIEELAHNEAFIKIISAAVEKSRDARGNVQSLLRCRAFKRQAITFMAKYAAIRDVAYECSKQMKGVQGNMTLFLTETPTKAQAKAMLKDETEQTYSPGTGEDESLISRTKLSGKDCAEAKRQFSMPDGYEEVQKCLNSPPAEQLTIPQQATN